MVKEVVLSLIIMITPGVWADCSAPVQPIKQGQQASCDGFLFSPDAEKQAAEARITADALKVKSKLQADENAILEQRLKLYMDATSNLSKEVSSRDSSRNLYNAVWFSMGLLVAGYAFRNIHP